MATIKKRTVLERDPVPALAGAHPYVFFTYRDDDDPHPRAYQMPLDDWVEMGSPDIITITIEPGDLLNGEPGW